MRYRLLGRSGLRVSEVGLGCMTFSDRGLSWGADPAQSRAIFEVFAEAGGTLVDTANIYGDDPGGGEGASERVLSDLIAADRDHFVLATKWTSSNTGDVSRSGNSAKAMRESLDASLSALRTDHVDMLWMHTWDGTTPLDEVLRGINQLIGAGKVLYWGFSDTPAWVVSQAVATAEARGWAPPVAIQVEHSLVERTAERELLPMAEALGLAVCPWSPLASGILSGKYTRDGGAAASSGEHRLRDEQFAGLIDAQDARPLTIAREVDAVADELGVASAHVALAWLRQRPGVVEVPLLGARRPDQLGDNLDGLELVLGTEQLDRLGEVSAIELGFPQAFLGSPMVRRSRPQTTTTGSTTTGRCTTGSSACAPRATGRPELERGASLSSARRARLR